LSFDLDYPNELKSEYKKRALTKGVKPNIQNTNKKQLTSFKRNIIRNVTTIVFRKDQNIIFLILFV